jgi:hypothetical protein
MQRTMVSGGARPTDNIAAAKVRAMEPGWTAARIGMDKAAQFEGRDVTFIGEATGLDEAAATATLRCIVSGASVTVQKLPPNADLSKYNEVTVSVEGGACVYASHGMLNDDFAEAPYKQLVELVVAHHKDLFF